MEVDDDMSSTAVFFNAREGVGFEGNNVLVKVDGREPDKGGVMLYVFPSNTYLCITDNAIAVASLLGLLKYLTTQRVRRTTIFNFNNGEEDRLNGAHAFLEHPWSKITHKFLNLEGAGAGGQLLLFRSTSLSPINNYISAFPHGTVISADPFFLGVGAVDSLGYDCAVGELSNQFLSEEDVPSSSRVDNVLGILFL
ncbi:hypothetical protein BDQ17DRAFT_1429100 [Cyathus striatus]|nr:hypothetical protein BDQ17DRAFT_1429100 [Cyathus striatus]